MGYYSHCWSQCCPAGAERCPCALVAGVARRIWGLQRRNRERHIVIDCSANLITGMRDVAAVCCHVAPDRPAFGKVRLFRQIRRRHARLPDRSHFDGLDP